MPKLSKDALAKRFPCEYCGEFFRTRQGLSGHIQFKHGTKQTKQPLDLKVKAERMLDLKILQKAFDVSDFTLHAYADAVAFWQQLQLFCKAFEIELNQQDLKKYLITSLVHIHQNERLMRQLITSLGNLEQ